MMMMMKMEIIGKETIKPSSPTPNHLKNFNLSLIDQLIPPSIYASLLLFYPNDHNHNNHIIPAQQKFHKLKNSLSQALTRFYPLAGRLKGNMSIDCEDQGVDYLEARIHGNLSTFLQKPDIKLLRERLLPEKPELSEAVVLLGLALPLLVVQASLFDCGGVSVGFYMSHKFGDASTVSTFIKDWALICSSSNSKVELVLPVLDLKAASIRFPPSRDFAVRNPPSLKPLKRVTKRFVFEESKIEALKAKAAASSYVKKPTRTEAITALIWRCAMSSSSSSSSKQWVIHQFVNFRKRVEPPLPENSVGNLMQYFSTKLQRQSSADQEVQDVVYEFRKSVEEFGKREAKRLENSNEAAQQICESWKERISMLISHEDDDDNDKIKIFTCSSLCNLDLYEVADFGWGKPIWIINDSGNLFNNFVLLTKYMRREYCSAVEAWVTLSEHDMALFEVHPQLLEFASLNPNVMVLENTQSVSKL